MPRRSAWRSSSPEGWPRVVSPPTTADLAHRTALDWLRGLDAVEFVAAFLAVVLADDAQAVALLRDATRLDDVELATFARRALVEVERQHRAARAIAARRARAAASSGGRLRALRR